MRVILGEPNGTRQHILLHLKEDGFSVEDINPESNPGMPKFKVKVGVVHLDLEVKKHLDRNKLVNLYELIEFIKTHKKSDVKIRIAIMDYFHISSYFLGMLMKIEQKENVEFTVFTKEVNSYKKIKEIIDCFEFISDDLETFSEAMKKTPVLFNRNALNMTAAKENLEGKSVLIVDSHNFYHRCFYGMPLMSNSKGVHTTLPKSLTVYLKSILKRNFDYVLFASEGQNGIRYSMYPEYKANREETAPELREQIKLCNELLEKMGFAVISEEGYEADDIIGSYAKTFAACGATVEIQTSDKDMYQLLNDKIKIYDPMKQIYIGEAECLAKFSVLPNKVVYALTLGGDTSDNVPGVKGVGPKKAAPLINEYGSVEGIYQNLDKIKGKLKENLEENRDNAFISYNLVKLYDYLADEVDLSVFAFPKYNFFGVISDDLSELEINL